MERDRDWTIRTVELELKISSLASAEARRGTNSLVARIRVQQKEEKEGNEREIFFFLPP